MKRGKLVKAIRGREEDDVTLDEETKKQVIRETPSKEIIKIKLSKNNKKGTPK